MKLLREGSAWALFAVVVGVFSAWPRYEMVGVGDAIVSVTFSHAAKRIGECRTLSQEELNKLPPNMRKPSECPRERHPINVELRSGNDVLYADRLAPSGIWSDGKANVYRRVVVQSGVHELFIGMSDSGRENGFDHETSERVDIAPGRNVVIRYDQQSQKFLIL